MPLVHVTGNLLKSDCEVIAHGCNCFHTMGSGIARQIKMLYPQAYDADLGTNYADREKLGTYSIARGTRADGHETVIFNIYSQYTYGSGLQLDYDALEQGLKAMARALSYQDPDNNLKVGLPRIGCGLAGGDWNRVKPLIESVFPERTVYVYTL